MEDMQSNISDTQKGLMEMQKSMNDVFTKRVMADIPQRVSPQDEFMMGIASKIFNDNPELFTDLMKQVSQSQETSTPSEILNVNMPEDASKEMSSHEKK